VADKAKVLRKVRRTCTFYGHAARNKTGKYVKMYSLGYVMKIKRTQKNGRKSRGARVW
jgi:hypothetical protein